MDCPSICVEDVSAEVPRLEVLDEVEGPTVVLVVDAVPDASAMPSGGTRPSTVLAVDSVVALDSVDTV